MASSMDNPVHSPIALNSLYIAKNKTTIVGSTITGKESAVICPTSSLNASVPVGLLNMYAASAKFKTELSRKDAATHQVAFFSASSNFSRVPRSSSAASILGDQRRFR